MKQKLLLVIPHSDFGGTERLAVDLARHLLQRGRDVVLAFPNGPGANHLLSVCKEVHVIAKATPAVKDWMIRRNLSGLIEFSQFIIKQNVEVVNLHYGANYISIWDVVSVRLAGRRCCVTVHHALPHSTRQKFFTLVSSWLCDRILLSTNATFNIFRASGISAEKITIIPLASTPPAPSNESKNVARLRFNIPDDAFVVGVVARLASNKKIDVLIRAFAAVDDTDFKMRLLIVGKGPETEELRQIAATQTAPGRIIFAGAIPDVNDAYRTMDIYAMPSSDEGFGLVYVEAAFHGLPSIACPVGGVPYVVIDGKTGIMVPVDDISALTSAIKQLRDQPQYRYQLGSEAKKRAFEEFTIDRMVERYENVLFPLEK